MSGRVVVIGAVNVDLVVPVPRLPAPGETVVGGVLQRHPGGKGANQAVAAARLGAPVALIGAVGEDPEGDQSRRELAAEGVDTSALQRVGAATGVALIPVAADGANQIVVSPGANALLSASAVLEAMSALDPGPGDVLLASLEVPMAAVVAAVSAAHERGMLTILNPAPAAPLPQEIISARPILTPNRGELSRLTSAADLRTGAARLLAGGATAVVATLGEGGSAVFDPRGREDLPPIKVEVVDPTGAGDCFNGVLAAELAAGRPLRAAARSANAAAALSVRAAGARAGMPRRREVAGALGS